MKWEEEPYQVEGKASWRRCQSPSHCEFGFRPIRKWQQYHGQGLALVANSASRPGGRRWLEADKPAGLGQG